MVDLSKDFYETLGVERTAKADAIQRAYEQRLAELAREEENEALRQRVQDAYEVLNDPEARAEYDEHFDEMAELREKAALAEDESLDDDNELDAENDSKKEEDEDEDEENEEDMNNDISAENMTAPAPTGNAEETDAEEKAPEGPSPEDEKAAKKKKENAIKGSSEGLMIGTVNVNEDGGFNQAVEAGVKALGEKRSREEEKKLRAENEADAAKDSQQTTANKQTNDQKLEETKLTDEQIEEKVVEQQEVQEVELEQEQSPKPEPDSATHEVEEHLEEDVAKTAVHDAKPEAAHEQQLAQAKTVSASLGQSPQQLVREARADQALPKQEAAVQRSDSQKLLSKTADTHEAIQPPGARFNTGMPAPRPENGGNRRNNLEDDQENSLKSQPKNQS